MSKRQKRKPKVSPPFLTLVAVSLLLPSSPPPPPRLSLSLVATHINSGFKDKASPEYIKEQLLHGIATLSGLDSEMLSMTKPLVEYLLSLLPLSPPLLPPLPSPPPLLPSSPPPLLPSSPPPLLPCFLFFYTFNIWNRFLSVDGRAELNSKEVSVENSYSGNNLRDDSEPLRKSDESQQHKLQIVKLFTECLHKVYKPINNSDSKHKLAKRVEEEGERWEEREYLSPRMYLVLADPRVTQSLRV